MFLLDKLARKVFLLENLARKVFAIKVKTTPVTESLFPHITADAEFRKNYGTWEIIERCQSINDV